MSHIRDAEVSRHDERSKAFLLGLYAGLTLLLLVVACMDDTYDPRLHKSTNIYALQALAGAALGMWRVRRQAEKPWATPAVAAVWVCCGLALWVVGQAIWTWASFQTVEPPYAGWSDPFYIASDVVWLVALLKIFQSLRRRGLTEIRPFMPIMIVSLILVVGIYTFVDWGYLKKSAEEASKLASDLGASKPDSNLYATLACDFIYILLTFASTILAVALLMGQNARIPLPVHQCVRWLCAAAALNAVAILAFTITVKHKRDALAYYDGNWVDWLFLTSMCCWGIAALKWPVRQEDLKYTFGTTRSGMTEADVYGAGEIARSCCKGAEEVERVSTYVNSTKWILDNLPRCWRVVKLGETVIGSTFLFPVSRELMEAFHNDVLKERELFYQVKLKGQPLAWDCLYLADASILSSHRRRGLAFEAFKTTIENIAKEYPQIEVHCWPTSIEKRELAEKLVKHFKDQQILVRTKE